MALGIGNRSIWILARGCKGFSTSKELHKLKKSALSSYMIDIERIKPEIEQICRILPVKRLGLFGSAVTPDFLPDSDVDVLVVFDSDENIDFFDKYFELKERLEKVFKRQVDLVVDKQFRNPVFRDTVEKTRAVIYER